MKENANGPGRPREAGSGRSIRREREMAAAVRDENERRRRIRRLLDRITDSAGDLGASKATFQAGVYHALRYLVPVTPMMSATAGIAPSMPTADQVRDDVFPADYRAHDPREITPQQYMAYCAVFDVLHGLEDLAVVAPQNGLHREALGSDPV